MGNYFTWHTVDAHPMDYVVYQDNAVLTSGALNDTTETITLFVDGLSVGTHNYTLRVTDMAGNSAVDTVIVTINEGVGTTTSGTTTPSETTNTTSGTGEPTGAPLSVPVDGIIIGLTYAGCIAGALLVTELYRRRYS